MRIIWSRRPLGLLATAALLTLGGAHASAREASGAGALEPVTTDLATLYCVSEGEWCPPIGDPAPMKRQEISQVGLDPPSTEATAATPKRASVRAELDLETPKVPGLEPVALDTAAVVCYSEGQWCGLLPEEAQPTPELGL